jgi:DNA-binding response OmpR family regulator
MTIEQEPFSQDELAARQRVLLREARRTAVQRVYATKDAAADQLIVAAERIRAEAFRSGDDDAVRQAQQLSRSLERAAMYLHGHTFDQMTGDATEMVQSKPWQAVVIAFLAGIIFARSFRRS